MAGLHCLPAGAQITAEFAKYDTEFAKFYNMVITKNNDFYHNG